MHAIWPLFDPNLGDLGGEISSSGSFVEGFDGTDGVVEVASGRVLRYRWVGYWDNWGVIGLGGASSRTQPQASCERFPSGGKKSFLGQFWVKWGKKKKFSFLGWFWCFFPAMAMGRMWRLLAWLALFCGEQQPNPIPLKKPHKKTTNHKKNLISWVLGGILGLSTAGVCSKKSLFPFFERGSENILYSLIFPQQKDFITSLPLQQKSLIPCFWFGFFFFPQRNPYHWHFFL